MVANAAAQRVRVLVIAGDRLFSERCRRSLEGDGHLVWIAPGWWVGVHLAELEAPDLVVVDEALADLDGLSVLAILKAHPSTARLPVVVAAQRERPELRARAERLGAHAIANKAELSRGWLLHHLAAEAAIRPSMEGRES